jgi:hypothetical protein
LPAKLEGQSDPLPSIGTIMPISGGSALEFETKKEHKARCKTSVWRRELRKQDGLISQSPSQKRT